MAFAAAARMHPGVSKSGSPTSRWMTSLPSEAMALAFSRTSMTRKGVIDCI